MFPYFSRVNVYITLYLQVNNVVNFKGEHTEKKPIKNRTAQDSQKSNCATNGVIAVKMAHIPNE